ncbi:MAG: flagellar hook-associated protein FlgK [Pseudomonadota bacterium]
MGLLSALNTAISGLNVNQQNIDVLSQNISNANTPNYSREVVNQKASFIAGQGQGVQVDSITRKIDLFINSELRNQTSTNSANSVTSDYYSQVQNLLGQPGAKNSIDQNISDFFIAVQNLANNSGAAAQTNVVNSANTAANNISGLANSLQGLRLQADKDISGAITNVNADLQNLIKINTSLQQANATNQNTSGLLDQRDATIKDLAQYVDIKPIFQPDGSTTINTSNGVTLLTGTTTSEISYSSINSINTFLNDNPLSAINVITLDANGNQLGQPVALAAAGKSSNVTSSLSGGKIYGLLSIRDSIVPNILNQLDQLASNFRDSFNKINNSGTSFPPPNSYTGQNLVSGATNSQYSGSIRIAALGANGSPISSAYPDEPNGNQAVTIDLSQLNTGQGNGKLSVDDLVSTINKYFAPPQNKTKIGNINNVQLAIDSNTIPDSGSNLNFDFNLNNISGTSADFYVGDLKVLDSNGNVVASNAAGTITTTQSSFALSSTGTYATNIGSDNVTITTNGGAGLVDGATIYLNPPSSAINGIPAASLGGFFKVSNVAGNTFQIQVAGAGALVNSNSPANASGVIGVGKYSTVQSGDTIRTKNDGIITASLASNTASSYYTVQANVANVDKDGKLITSTVSYRITNNGVNTANTLIGATSLTGAATLVRPTTTQPAITASLVDANGNQLQKINGLYGNQQGYFKIAAANSSNSVAIDELDSKQLGLPNNQGNLDGTNQGFSQYFALNNFFNANSAINSTDAITNSAVNLSVASRIKNNPSLVSTGKISLGNQPSDATKPPNFTYNISSGDNSVIQQLAGLSTGLINFPATSGLAASSTTFSQFAGQIIATASTNSSVATTTQKNSQALLDGYTTSAGKISGVNLDQELANTIIYQNSYSASARIVTVVSKLFDTLIGSIQ